MVTEEVICVVQPAILFGHKGAADHAHSQQGQIISDISIYKC